jgi:hypothetical protein
VPPVRRPAGIDAQAEPGEAISRFLDGDLLGAARAVSLRA